MTDIEKELLDDEYVEATDKECERHQEELNEDDKAIIEQFRKLPAEERQRILTNIMEGIITFFQEPNGTKESIPDGYVEVTDKVHEIPKEGMSKEEKEILTQGYREITDEECEKLNEEMSTEERELIEYLRGLSPELRERAFLESMKIIGFEIMKEKSSVDKNVPRKTI